MRSIHAKNQVAMSKGNGARRSTNINFVLALAPLPFDIEPKFFACRLFVYISRKIVFVFF